MTSGCRVAGRVFRFCVVSALVFAGPGFTLAPTHSQTTGDKTDMGTKPNDLLGEWKRAGAGFACIVKPPDKFRTDPAMPEIMARACLHMGPFVIGDDAQVLIAALGTPHRTLPQADGAKALIYFLEQAGQYPYFVATVSKNKIVALQVTGPVAANGYTFNHVDLGATTDTLVQYFGRPNHLEPSDEKDTDLWLYRPWPFSFEIRGGHVTSIRIAAPN